MTDGGTPSALAPATDRSTAGRALGWILGVLVGIATFATLWEVSLPGSMFFLLLPLALVWLTAAGIWIALVVHDIRRRRASIVTLVVPLVVAGTAALGLTDIPLQVRFDLARGAMQDAVDTMPADDDAVIGNRLVGTYMIRFLDRVDGGVILTEAIGNSVVDDAGFAYLPAGPTPEPENGSFESPQWHDLGGGWWSWTASW